MGTNMQTVTSLVDHAAQQSFQWLFVAAICIMALAVMGVARVAFGFFVRSQTALVADLKSEREKADALREEYHVKMEEVVAHWARQNEKTIAVMAASERAIISHTEAVRAMTQQIIFCQKGNGKAT